MRIKGEVPIEITKEGVKFAKRRVAPLVAPSEPPVLYRNLLELTIL
jgi:hypothetical protein